MCMFYSHVHSFWEHSTLNGRLTCLLQDLINYISSPIFDWIFQVLNLEVRTNKDTNRNELRPLGLDNRVAEQDTSRFLLQVKHNELFQLASNMTHRIINHFKLVISHSGRATTANTRHSTNAALILGQRRRRCPNIKAALVQMFMVDGTRSMTSRF